MLNDACRVRQPHSTFNIQHSTFLVISLYAALALLVIPVFPHFRSPNEFTRWATAVAIVDLHRLEVTPLMPLLGPDFEDLAEVDGRLYSNKAPGGALVGLPAYALVRVIAGPPSPQTMRAAVNAMRLAAATLPTLILAIAFVIAARRLGGENEGGALAAMLFGTPIFAYGLLNFSHALTAMALFAAWLLLFVAPSAKGDLAAGALIGLAVISEFPVAVAVIPLMACAIGSRSIARIVAGGAPFAIGLAIYNKVVFGTLMTMSYRFERFPAYRDVARHGVFGIGLPEPGILMRLLFSPERGLFVFSPILLVALTALPRLREKLTPRQRWSLVLTPPALIVAFAGYPNWHGGWTVGARYLVPAMPFLAFLLVFVRWSWLTSLCLGASVVACALTSLVFPFVPQNVPAPWGTFAWPMLRQGLIAPNVLHFVARPLAIAVPLAIVIAAMLIATPRRAWAIAGAALWLVVGIAAPVQPIVSVERAFIEEVNFERDGAIARAVPPGMSVNPRFIAQARRARTQPPPSWPF